MGVSDTSCTARLVKTRKVVRELEYGTTRNVGSIVSILTHNFLARKDKIITDFYAHMKLYPGFPWEKQQTLFTSKLKINLSKKLVKYYIWSIVLYCAGNWTIRNLDQKYTENFEMWCWKTMAKVSLNDHVRNEVLRKVKEERNVLQTEKRKKVNWTVYIFNRNCLLKHVIE